MNRNQCLKKNRTADGSAYLNMTMAQQVDTFETNDVSGGGSVSDSPVKVPAQQVDPSPVLPSTTTVPLPYSDSQIEYDYYSASCKTLTVSLSYIQNILATAKIDIQTRAYYEARLADIQKAYTGQQCGVIDIVNINNPATVTNPDAGSSTTSTSPAISTTSTVTTESITPTAAATVTPASTSTLLSSGLGTGGAGGGGGGGGDQEKKAAPTATKRNWWLIAVCVATIGISMYMGRNETI
jgi:hypothetical protein